MTQPNDTPRKNELDQMVADFKKMNDEAMTEGKKKIADLEQVEERVSVNLRSSTARSPQYYELTNLKHFIDLEIRIQFHQMLNASYLYILTLHTAMVVQSILEKQNPTLTEEAERMKEELRKTINEQIAKKVSGLFSDEGHEVMYGHA